MPKQFTKAAPPPDYTLTGVTAEAARIGRSMIVEAAEYAAGHLYRFPNVTMEQALNTTVHNLMHTAAHYAIQNAYQQGREPDFDRWAEVTMETARKVHEEVKAILDEREGEPS